MRRRKLPLLLVGCLCIISWKLLHHYNSSRSEQTTSSINSASSCEPIDLVYTWVNGSDPQFIDAVHSYDAEYDPARFDDKQELRYSLRSLEQHAPWVRHVYILTNGQIPHWLDLNYARVTIVPHALLATETMLPTFSSAAIETLLHRIPGLSQRFLYMNDDIFLGAPLYPEDLYTASEGVHVYSAWTVPDCANDCPWVYIGDGACDPHCNIAECQYDGGDCVFEASAYAQSIDTAHKSLLFNATQSKVKPKKSKSLSSPRHGSFKDVMQRHRNASTLHELQRIVGHFNERLKNQRPSFASTLAPPSTSHKNNVTSSLYKSSKDIYSQSLIYTNMLLNRHYGFRARNVLAHVGFLLDRDIIAAMQQKFREEFTRTAQHRFRAADDLQFAFVYYSFLMSESYNASIAQIFDEFDTDSSHTWSDREVRTFLTRMYPLPLDWSAVHYFEEVIENCSRKFKRSEQQEIYTTLVYERYEDSNVPTITRELVAQCELLADALLSNFATRSKYKYVVNSKRGLHSNFMMLTSNVSEVVDALDRMRRNPKKFNCINDNLEPQFREDNELIRHLLEDFYVSFFPRRSKFELHEHLRNRFTNWDEYQSWRQRKTIALFIGYGASAVLLIFLLRFLCWHKAKFVRRYVQKL